MTGSTRLAAPLCVAAAVAIAACSGSDGSDDTGAATTVAAAEPTSPPTGEIPDPTPTTTPVTDTPAEPAFVGPVAAPVRNPLSARPIYFVMPDRFENGDPTNDTGGVTGGPLEHGHLPEDRGFHHGGDLAGLTARLPYLAELGMGSIWITPPFTNRFVQGDGTIEGSSSSYHG